MTIVAAADGSALGNPGPAGWAWYVDDDCWRAGGWPHGTNNMGELMAVLDLFRSTADRPDEDLRILCDSQYVINCVTKWMPGWKRKGWRKADGKPVLNVDLLKEIDKEIVGRKYSFEWVKGHAGHPLNEAADDRARAAATAYQAGVPAKQGPGFVGTTSAEAEAEEAPNTVEAVALDEIPLGGADQSSVEAELDLFSFIEVEETAQQDKADPAYANSTDQGFEQVVDLERELLDPLVRADSLRLGELLHKDFSEIGSSGQLWTRAQIIERLVDSPSKATQLQVISVAKTDSESVLLCYRSFSGESGTGSNGAGASALRSSLWVQVDGRWQLRFHQGTREHLG